MSTEIQQKIEDVITNGAGFHDGLGDSYLDLQIHLGEMDLRSGPHNYSLRKDLEHLRGIARKGGWSYINKPEDVRMVLELRRGMELWKIPFPPERDVAQEDSTSPYFSSGRREKDPLKPWKFGPSPFHSDRDVAPIDLGLKNVLYGRIPNEEIKERYSIIPNIRLDSDKLERDLRLPLRKREKRDDRNHF
ncbi:MAG: hypothetical protein AABW89_03715 [Nanoarchaeota archaeon]